MAYVERRLMAARSVTLWIALIIPMLSMMSTQTYGAASYPPADHPWGVAEYQRLLLLIGTRQQPFPTLADKASKAVFKRMISAQNVAQAKSRDESLPAGERMMALATATVAVKRVAVLYLKEINEGKPYERELAKLLVYLLDISGPTIKLADEFIASIPRDDQYEIRLGGLRQAHNGLRQMFSGVIISISETHLYSKPSTLELIQASLNNLPTYQPILTKADCQKAIRIVERQLKATNDKELQAGLTRLQDALHSIK